MMHSGRRARAAYVIGVALLGACLGLPWAMSGEATPYPLPPAPVSMAVPLSFEVNRGQADGGVDFLARGAGYNVFITAREAVVALRRPGRAAAVRMSFIGAAGKTSEGVEPLPSRSNYLRGQDPSRWITDVHHFARVRVRDLYPGVDVLYYGRQRQLEYDLVVAPGADPGAIAIGFDGVDTARLDDNGALVLGTGNEQLVQSAPIIYQETDGGRTTVSGGYVARADRSFGFHVAPYDRTRPLIIDPVLSYSTFLGDTIGDECHAIATDAAGNHYVTGRTTSTAFPTASPFDATSNGGFDVFVTKLNSTLSAPLVYSTYVGGSGDDEGIGIAVDATGRAYVTGRTISTDFPTLVPFDATSNGGFDALVFRLSPAGSALEYSTYIGGAGDDETFDIAVDASNAAYITGRTVSDGFPVTVGVVQSVKNSGNDAFVTKLNSAGSGGGLVYSTFHGGSGDDIGRAIALDSSNNAYVTGSSASTDLPTVGPFQAANDGGTDAFVTKFNTGATARLYSTYLGGSGDDIGRGIAVDSSGSAYVTGRTTSTNLDTVSTSLDTSFNGSVDAFVTKFVPAGNAITYSTYLGGIAIDDGNDIALSGTNAYIVGFSTSSDYPVWNAFQPVWGGDNEVIVSVLNSTGSAFVYSTFLGSINNDTGMGIAVSGGEFCVAGFTGSVDFPVTTGAFDTTYNFGTFDGFVACFRDAAITINDVSVAESAGTATFTVTMSQPSAQPVTVQYSTFDFTAVAPGDYTAIAPTVLTFPAGTTSLTVVVTIVNDAVGEPTEVFYVHLSGATGGAAISDARGQGTITNDDGAPIIPPDV